MKNLPHIFGFGAALGVVIASTTGCSKASAQQPSAQTSPTVDLTIYTGGFGMISEHRPVHLTAGRNKVVLDNVSRMLDASSILVDWPKGSAHPDVVGTTYDMDRSDGGSMLKRLNGKQVEFMWNSSNGKPGETISGTLEVDSSNRFGGGFDLRTQDRLYVNPSGTVLAPPDTPSGLPVLSVQLNTPSETSTQMGVSYISGGLGWKADYVAKLNPNSETADLECWASVVNRTGTSYPNARITLVAGQPNVAFSDPTLLQESSQFGATLNGVNPLSSNIAGGAALTTNAPRTAVGELYAYKIASIASISTDQANRVSVLGTRTVPINRSYTIVVPDPESIPESTDASNGSQHLAAESSISFLNIAASNLGIPLPSGQVRVYDRDAAGAEQFVGADTLADTTKGAHVRLNLATAFDVYATARLISRVNISKHKVRCTFESTVFNEKKITAPVVLIQQLPTGHKLITESEKGENNGATLHQWRLSLKPGETRKITCTLEI